MLNVVYISLHRTVLYYRLYNAPEMQKTNTRTCPTLKIFYYVPWQIINCSTKKWLIVKNRLNPGHWCTDHHEVCPESWSVPRALAGVLLIDSFPPERGPVCMSHCWRIRVWPEINWILIQCRAVPKTAIWRYSIQIVWQPSALNSDQSVNVFIW